LTISLYESLKHRETAQHDAGALAETVCRSLISEVAETGVIEKTALVSTVGTVLNRFDTVAALHYAAFHKKK
jgi:transcriptional regulator NrdR family protein